MPSEVTVEMSLQPCTNCGHPISRAATACPACKASAKKIAEEQIEEIAFPQPPQLPGTAVAPMPSQKEAEIRERLRKHQRHSHLTCLECGYSGLMGVESAVVPFYASWWFGITVAFVLAFLGSLGFGAFGGLSGLVVLIFFFWATRGMAIKPVLRCPSCDRAITPTETGLV